MSEGDKRMSGYTMEMRLCDADGIISTKPIADGFPTQHTSYLDRLNSLRAISGHKPYVGDSFPCTGNAHLAFEHIRCTNQLHWVAVGVTINVGITEPSK